MKRIFMFMALAVFAAALVFSLRLNANAETIIGEVTFVGEKTFKVKEDITQMESEFKASPDKLEDVKTGYRVEVKATNGNVLSLVRLGMPMQAEPEPYQKWRITKYPGGEEVVTKIPPAPAPPSIRMEERSVAPSTTSVWIPGYWEWNGHEWVWIPGKWVEPPYTEAVWVSSHWEWNGHQWVWVLGHWKQ